jgi:hypothetical protein
MEEGWTRSGRMAQRESLRGPPSTAPRISSRTKDAANLRQPLKQCQERVAQVWREKLSSLTDLHLPNSVLSKENPGS